MIGELEQIKVLLWEEWDPIGVNDSPCARDEYDSYAFQLFISLRQGMNEASIAEYLRWAELEHMGLSHSSGREANIAQKVLTLHHQANQEFE